jgi:signal transduction histidine kinase/ligand-binding sensor domain-containing protein/DNA-binding response OmpR family regulator
LALTLFILLIAQTLYPHCKNNGVTFNRLTTRQGLSNNRVTGIVKDAAGFAWVSTLAGLNRFDGYEFKKYPHDPRDPNSPGGDIIWTLFADRQGDLWLGTKEGGLNKYDSENDRFIRYLNDPDNPHSLSDNSVRAIYEDKNGVLWIGTSNGGLNKFDRQGGRFIHYKKQPENPASLIHDNVTAIYEDSGDNLWIGTAGGLDRLDRETGDFVHYRFPADAAHGMRRGLVFALHEDRFGDLWIGTFSGLWKLDSGTDRINDNLPANAHDILGPTMVFAVHEDRDGRLWFGTADGLIRLDRDSGVFTRYQNRPYDIASLSHNSVRLIYQDNLGALWFGTWGGGISILDPGSNKFELYRHDPENTHTINSNLVMAVYENPSGILWIGTWEDGIDVLKPNAETFAHYRAQPSNPASLSSDKVRAIVGGRGGGPWVGTWGGGLDKFDPDTRTFSHFKHHPDNPASLISNFISCLYEDANGIVWVGTKKGLDRFDPGMNIFTHYRPTARDSRGLDDTHITCIYEDRPGMLWIGTAKNGLKRLDRQTGKFMNYTVNSPPSRRMSSSSITCIHEDRGGILWVGTGGGGLVRLEKDPARGVTGSQFYTVKNGLPSGEICGILEDGDGCLWLSTKRGLSKFDPPTRTFTNYEPGDGIQGDEFNPGAYFKNPRTGEMYFGGSNGLNHFFPIEVKNEKTNTVIPPVVITAVNKFNKPMDFPGPVWRVNEITIPRSDNFISFEFAALNFRKAEKNRYRYKLEGFDNEWMETGKRRYAAYTNLEGGTYVFRVIGSNDDGVWNTEGASITINILPPFWATGWFKFLGIGGLIALASLLLLLRTRRTKLQRRRLEALVAERTRELQSRQRQVEEAREAAIKERLAAEAANRSKSEFLARMSHEIRTPMNAVLGFTEMIMETELNGEQQDFIRTINRSGQLMLALIDDILDFSRAESGQLTLDAIDFSPGPLVFEVCDLVRPRIGSKPVELISHIDKNLPPYVKGDPGRFRQVLINLMTNAVKFTEKGEIEIKMALQSEDGDAVTIHSSVRDSGIGIALDKQKSVFEVFQQAEDYTTREYGGFGLGLAICRQISRLMGGDVWVESEPGKGSTFHFVAVLGKSGQKPVEPVAAPPVCVKGKRALLVDDNPVNLEILKRMLGDIGMETTALTRGSEVLPALQQASQNGCPFDVCILDIHMPHISGYELARQIRGLDSPISRIPLLAFTSSFPKRNKHYRESGFDDFLTKPIQAAKLTRVLEQLLGKTKAKEAHRQTKESKKPRETERTAPLRTVTYKPARSLDVLLVEDDPINQKLARHLLTRAGHRITVASNGKEALDVYTAAPGKYDIVFMDVQLPQMDGLETTRLIRSRGFDKVPIIAMTAQAMRGDREKCIEAGMNDYIPKPIKQKLVLDMIEKWTKHN